MRIVVLYQIIRFPFIINVLIRGIKSNFLSSHLKTHWFRIGNAILNGNNVSKTSGRLDTQKLLNNITLSFPIDLDDQGIRKVVLYNYSGPDRLENDFMYSESIESYTQNFCDMYNIRRIYCIQLHEQVLINLKKERYQEREIIYKSNENNLLSDSLFIQQLENCIDVLEINPNISFIFSKSSYLVITTIMYTCTSSEYPIGLYELLKQLNQPNWIEILDFLFIIIVGGNNTQCQHNIMRSRSESPIFNSPLFVRIIHIQLIPLHEDHFNEDMIPVCSISNDVEVEIKIKNGVNYMTKILQLNIMENNLFSIHFIVYKLLLLLASKVTEIQNDYLQSQSIQCQDNCENILFFINPEDNNNNISYKWTDSFYSAITDHIELLQSTYFDMIGYRYISVPVRHMKDDMWWCTLSYLNYQYTHCFIQNNEDVMTRVKYDGISSYILENQMARIYSVFDEYPNNDTHSSSCHIIQPNIIEEKKEDKTQLISCVGHQLLPPNH